MISFDHGVRKGDIDSECALNRVVRTAKYEPRVFRVSKSNGAETYLLKEWVPRQSNMRIGYLLSNIKYDIGVPQLQYGVQEL